MKDRRIATVTEYLTSVINLYKSRGFTINTIFGNYEFELLRPWHPNLNTTAADKHVTDIKRHMRTIKDSTQSTYRLLPFRCLPQIALIDLVKKAVFWLNAVAPNQGWHHWTIFAPLHHDGATHPGLKTSRHSV